MRPLDSNLQAARDTVGGMLERKRIPQNEEELEQSSKRATSFRDRFEKDLGEFRAACTEGISDDPVYREYIAEILREAEAAQLRLNTLVNNPTVLRDFYKGTRVHGGPISKARLARFPGAKEIHEAWRSAFDVMEKMRWEKSRLPRGGANRIQAM